MPFDFTNDFMNNSALQYGLNLLGSRGTKNPYATAQTAMQEMQIAQQAQQLRQAQTIQDAALAGKRIQETRKLEMINLLLAQAIAKRQSQFGGQIPTQPPADENMGPQPGQRTNPFNGFTTPGVQDIGARPVQQQAQGQNPNEIMPALNPDAEMWALAENDELAKMYQQAYGQKIGPTGIVTGHTYGGGIGPVPGSLQTLQQFEEMKKSIERAHEQVTVPLDNGQEVTMSGLEADTYNRTGQLPQRVINQFGLPPNQAAPANVAPSSQAQAYAVPSNNVGNMRPAGASTGFQKFTSPEAGMAAIDKQLQIYGNRGVNTLGKIIGTWSPPNENDTQALVAAASKRLGIPADRPLDMSNPVVRQLVSSAIMLQEHGSKLFAAAQPAQQQPEVATRALRVGVRQSPAQAAQAKVFAEEGDSELHRKLSSYLVPNLTHWLTGAQAGGIKDLTTTVERRKNEKN